MIQETREFTTEIAVIGSGLAGFAASIFGLNRRLSVAQAGNTGAIAYTTGYLDLLGCTEDGIVDNPWQAIAKLRKEDPTHPLSMVEENDIRTAFSQFTTFISECGISYTTPGEQNLTAITPAGTSKPTCSVPATMRAGVTAYESKAPCVIIDFKGLRGFSALQVKANLAGDWPQLRAERLPFPAMDSGEIYPEVMARALEVPDNQQKLASSIKEILGDAQYVGLPAILGMHTPDLVMERLSELVGKPVFEIPTMPPSVPGIRLREMFEQIFPQRGLTLIPQQKIDEVSFSDEAVHLSLTDNHGPIRITAKAAILATGRFLSGGLEADIKGVREPLLDLHVNQPASRKDWYRESYMDTTGHPVHKSGIIVNARFQPLNANGDVVDPKLFAAGIVLANQDWIRDRCGAGVAIATAYKAVEGAAALCSTGS